MATHANLQEKETVTELTDVKHQKAIGTGYFDTVTKILTLEEVPALALREINRDRTDPDLKAGVKK
jgi:isocitrate lyase